MDSLEPAEMPHMMIVARKWLAAENERMVRAGETAYCESPAHIVGWLIAEVQRLRHAARDRISDAGESLERTQEPHATPSEGTSQGGCMERRELREFHRRLMAMGGVPGRISYE